MDIQFKAFIERTLKKHVCPTTFRVTFDDGVAPSPSRPHIILDIDSIIETIYPQSSDWICGGNFNVAHENLKHLIHTLKCSKDGEPSLDIVAFSSGGFHPNAIKDWAKKQRQNQKVVSLFETNNPINVIKSSCIVPYSLSDTIRLTLAAVGIKIHAAVIGDINKDICNFYMKNKKNCIGVLSRNPFLIFYNITLFYPAPSKDFFYHIDSGSMMKSLEISDSREKIPSLLLLFGCGSISFSHLSPVYRHLLAGYPQIANASERQVIGCDALFPTIIKFVQDNNVQNIAPLVARICGLSLDEVILAQNNVTENFFSKYGSCRKRKVIEFLNEGSCSDDVFSDDFMSNNDMNEASNEEEHYALRWQHFRHVHNKMRNGATDIAVSESLERLSINEVPPASIDHSPIPSCLNLADSQISIFKSPDSAIYSGSSLTSNSDTGGNYKTMSSFSVEVKEHIQHNHMTGCISPKLFPLMKLGEIEIDAGVDIQNVDDPPPATLLYRNVRIMIYSILFSKEPSKTVYEDQTIVAPIHEWCCYKGKDISVPDVIDVPCRPSSIPAIDQLWFDPSAANQQKRLNAFLMTFNCNVDNFLSNNSIPERLFVMCCVLRYLVNSGVLSKHDLHAFIAQAIGGHLEIPDNGINLSHVRLKRIDARPIQLAALFTAGVEMALLSNDACGSPLPKTSFHIWSFFDGRLFHHMWLRSTANVSLLELSNEKAHIVNQHELLYWVITSGIEDRLKKCTLPPMDRPHASSAGVTPAWMNVAPPEKLRSAPAFPMSSSGIRPAGVRRKSNGSGGRGRATNRANSCPGGTLEISGIPVSHWSGSAETSGGRGRSSSRHLSDSALFHSPWSSADSFDEPFVRQGHSGQNNFSNPYRVYQPSPNRNNQIQRNPAQNSTQKKGYNTKLNNYKPRRFSDGGISPSKPPRGVNQLEPTQSSTELWLGKGRGRASFKL